MAIAFVREIGQAQTKSSGTSVAITVPAAGVAAGCSIVLAIGCVTTAATVSATDTAGNTYAVDADASNAAAVRVLILSAHNVNALVSGDTITVSWSVAVTVKSVTAVAYSGLATTSTRDKTSTGTGTGTAPSSGATATTTAANELVVGAVAYNGFLSDGLTAGAGFTARTGAGTSTSTAATNRVVFPEDTIVAATGAQTADGTIGGAGGPWATAVATYKAASGGTAHALAGSMLGTGTQTGVARATKPLAASSLGTGMAAGTIVVPEPFTLGTSTLGGLDILAGGGLALALIGVSDGAGDQTGSLARAVELAGTTTGSGTATAALTVFVAVVPGDLAGDLRVTRVLTAALDAASVLATTMEAA